MGSSGPMRASGLFSNPDAFKGITGEALDPRYSSLNDADKALVKGYYDNDGMSTTAAIDRIELERRKAEEARNQANLQTSEQEKMKRLDSLRTSSMTRRASTPTFLGGLPPMAKAGKRLLGY